MVTWGSLNFQGVLEHVVSRYTMFLSDGTPVRAVLAVTFRQYRSAEEQTQETPRESADHTKRRIVREGDTLQLIAAREYNKASEWRRIARANRIADPLELTPGQELVIPPLP
jgi:nucleoid-associated protein YgaU